MLMKWLIQLVLWQGVMAILLFVPAGTINWTGAWIFLIETFVVSAAFGLWLARHDPALLKERLRSPIQKGQSIQDQIVTGVLVLLYFGWFAFMALDAIRFKWSSVPAWLQGPAALGVLVACYIGYLTLRENTFAAPGCKNPERARPHCHHQRALPLCPPPDVRRYDILFLLRTSAFRFLVGASLGMCPAWSVRDSYSDRGGNPPKRTPRLQRICGTCPLSLDPTGLVNGHGTEIGNRSNFIPLALRVLWELD